MEDLRLIVFGNDGPYSRFYHALETLQALKQSQALDVLAREERLDRIMRENEHYIKNVVFSCR